MPVAETASTWVGIINENEFYSHHYLSEVFTGDIKDVIKQWGTQENEAGFSSPSTLLKGLHQDYFAIKLKLSRTSKGQERINLQRGFSQQLISVLQPRSEQDVSDDLTDECLIHSPTLPTHVEANNCDHIRF